jgi:hypothetical protein
MISMAMKASAKSVTGLADKIVAIASCIVIPVLVASTVVWSVDRPPRQELWFARTVEVPAGQSTRVGLGIPLTMGMPMKRGRYWIAIESGGHSVYTYPTQKLIDPHQFDFGTLAIETPTSLPPGKYDVVMHIEYWFNPFKDGRSSIRVSELSVKQEVRNDDIPSN